MRSLDRHGLKIFRIECFFVRRTKNIRYEEQKSMFCERLRNSCIIRGVMNTPETPQSPADPSEVHQDVAATQIEQLIEHIGARYIADLRTLSEEIGRFYEARLIAKDEQIAELSRRVEATEREREALEARIHDLKSAHERFLANLRALPEELGRRIEGADHDHDTIPARTGELERKQEAISPASESASSGFTSSKTPIPRLVQVRQSQIAHLREHLVQLQAAYHALRGQVRQSRERPPAFFSYRSVFIFVLCAAVLIAISILLLGNPRDGANVPGLGAPDVARTSALLVASAPALAVPSRAAPESQPSPHSKETPVNSQTAQPSGARTVAGPTAHPSFLPLTPTTASQPSPAAQVLLQRVAAAEAALRTGQLEATITYGSGLRSSARVRFDLGDERHVPRFQITTTYEGTNGVQTTERITIGDQSWERQQDGQWTVMPARESALKQLQVFLPRTDSISNVTRVTVEGTYVLRWYDAARDADVTLRVDTAGIPQQLRRVSRANGLTRTVTYRGLNTPVEITPPDAT